MTVEVGKLTDAELFVLLAELDLRKQARLLQQVRSELGLRGVAFQEQLITDAAGPRWQITPRQKVIPSKQSLLAGSAPVDWNKLKGQRFLQTAMLLTLVAMLAPSFGVYPSHAVSHNFLMGYYLGVMLLGGIVIMLAYPRDFQTVRRKWVVEQSFRLCSLGLCAFAGQIPVQLCLHQLLQQPWQQQAQVLDLRRNSEWCRHQVTLIWAVEPNPLAAPQTPESAIPLNTRSGTMDLCDLSSASFDSLRPNDPVNLVGSSSAVAIVVRQIQLTANAEFSDSLQ